MELIFSFQNCSTTNPESTPELVASEVNGMNFTYNKETGVLNYTPTREWYANLVIYAILPTEEVVVNRHVSYWTTGGIVEVVLSEEQRLSVTGFKIEMSDASANWDYATTSIEVQIIGNFIYPTGTVDEKALPVTLVGFNGQKDAVDYSHIQILVAEIRSDEEVGGEGHVWESPFYPKDADYSTSLENIMPICEGQELTKFNVSFHFVQENADGGFDFVRAHVVGGATTSPTFNVLGKALPLIHVDLISDTDAYSLDPVILTVNRHEHRKVQNVRVEIGNYVANFEFKLDRNLLEIDIAEYLKVLFANVDIFEYQQVQTTLLVKLYDADWNLVQIFGTPINVIYGKNPVPALSSCKMRVHWVDKYGILHDEYFKIADNLTEGASAQKYVTNCEEREEKTGEKSITLAKVLVSNAEREDLKTIVFADHVRAYIGDTWKRVRIANTYKTGAGREKKNFEITIKYSL